MIVSPQAAIKDEPTPPKVRHKIIFIQDRALKIGAEVLKNLKISAVRVCMFLIISVY
jgi:hypothetical protein